MSSKARGRLARLLAAGFIQVIQQRVSSCKTSAATLNDLIALSDSRKAGFIWRFEREWECFVCKDTGQEHVNSIKLYVAAAIERLVDTQLPRWY